MLNRPLRPLASTLLLLSALMVMPAIAQTGKPATDTPSAPERSHRNTSSPGGGQNNNPEGSDMEKSAPAALGRADRSFITKVAGNGLYELEASRLAATRASDPKVKKLAAQTVAENTQARKELEELASKHNYPLPSRMPEDKQPLVTKLSQIKGKDFDRFYVHQVAVKDRKDDLKLAERALRATKTGDVKAWIDKHLPLMKARLQAAEDIEKG
ncbi:conserved exported hypothetical protein [Burkholderiales bacterium 8X]|nr:conserved exported hypothetical protein [Burkholderiales bacterium 8X]